MPGVGATVGLTETKAALIAIPLVALAVTPLVPVPTLMVRLLTSKKLVKVASFKVISGITVPLIPTSALVSVGEEEAKNDFVRVVAPVVALLICRSHV